MGKNREKRVAVPRKPSLKKAREVLNSSIQAELERVIDKKQYTLDTLAGLLEDEKQLGEMLRCKHEKIAFKDGVFICEKCQWMGWL